MKPSTLKNCAFCAGLATRREPHLATRATRRPISRRLRRKLSRSQSRRKSARCSGWTFWKGQKLHSPPKAPTGPRSRPPRQSLPASCMCAAKNAARNAASAQRHRFPRVIAGSAAGKRSSKICARCECGSAYRYHTNIQDAAFDMPCLNCEAPVALEWNENKNRYQPMNSEPPKARRGRK